MPATLYAVIFTGGVLRDSPAVQSAIAASGLIVAADGGADAAVRFGHSPHVVVGDLDSISPAVHKQLVAEKCEFVTSPAQKDETDTELAVAYALTRHAGDITILGGIEGDRIDHILANIFHVSSLPVPTRFINGHTTAWAVTGPAAVPVHGAPGDVLSLLPLTPEITGVTLTGLQYPLHAATMAMTSARGISNVLTAPEATVTFARGRLLLVHIDKAGL